MAQQRWSALVQPGHERSSWPILVGAVAVIVLGFGGCTGGDAPDAGPAVPAASSDAPTPTVVPTPVASPSPVETPIPTESPTPTPAVPTPAQDIDDGEDDDECDGGPGGDGTEGCETSQPVGAVDWSDPTQGVAIDDWIVVACEGDAPLLCVSHPDLAIVGVVDGTVGFDLSNSTLYDPAASDAENLRTFAADSHAAIARDRGALCEPGYTVELTEPRRLDSQDRVAIGFAQIGTNPDGTPSEYHFSYLTISEGRVVWINANAYNDPGCPGRNDQSTWTTDTLMQAQPIIEAVLEASPLPPT